MMLPLIWLFLLLPERPPQNSVVYTGNSGTIRFISDAELERIEAASDQLAGAINSETREVFFSLRVGSFVGFNGGLQQEHFYENYLETDVFPSATFKGRIVDDVNLKKNGTYAVRVKGMLTIHGISTERIIDGTITVSGAGMKVESAFPVLLDDHNITIPKIVEMKISPEVKVDLKINLTRNSS